jgi:lysozyme
MTDILDISHWNTVADWKAIHAAGVAGVIHKASQGSHYRDPVFERHRAQAKAAGLLFGRYHFGEGEDVPGQVTNFLQGWTPDEALALDYEANVRYDATGNLVPAGPSMSLSEAEEFVAEVFTRTGVLPAIYSGATLKEALAARQGSSPLLKCRLWLAQLGPSAKLPLGFTSYWCWQFTANAHIPGVTGYVDRSMFDGSPAELAASWAPQGVPPAAVVAETPYQQYKRLAIERGLFPQGEVHQPTWADLVTLLRMVPIPLDIQPMSGT